MLDNGQIVAGYRIDGVVGGGGMGTVYRATQLSLNRVVALKLLSAELSDDEGFRTRFQREGQLQAGLDHQHIVTVYEAGQTEQGLFLAMRLIDGPTLKNMILSNQLDPRRSVRVLAQVAQALDAAHEAGLIHRDIKPQNILVGKGDHAYLCDFGLIKAPDDAHLTGTGQFLGTIDYVAPEQIQGEPATGASDCYALTAVLYECLTGEVPFGRPHEAATIQAHLTEPPPKVTDNRPDLPEAIDDVIARGMAKNHSQRPPSAGDLVTEAVVALSQALPQAGPGSQPTRIAGTVPDVGGAQVTRVPGAGAAVAVPTVLSPAQPTRAAGVVAPTAASAKPVTAPAAPTIVTTPEAPARAQPLVAVILGVLAVAAAVGGFVLGHGGKSSGSVAFSSSATVGNLELRYPSSWQLSSAPPALPGLSFSSPIVLTSSAAGGTLAAGEVVGAGGPTLLPATLRSRLQSPLATGRPVQLGAVEAYSYTGLQVHGLGSPLDVYAVPTSGGVATIACTASGRTAPAFYSYCAQVAATLRLLSVSAFPLGPSVRYARLLSNAFNHVRTATAGPLLRLNAAATPSAQASAARALAMAYNEAATTVSGITASPLLATAQPAILAALHGLAGGYTRAASAAQSGDKAGYGRAGTQIGSASAALTAALHGLAVLGYTVGG